MELEPGAGVFYFEHNQAKELDPEIMHRNLSCERCHRYRGDVEESLKWCKGCESVAYCSKECQRVDWPTHKPACKSIAHQLSLLDVEQRALADPKILHYLQVAIIINGNILSDPPSKRGERLRTARVNVSLYPNDQTFKNVNKELLNTMVGEDSDLAVFPAPDQIEAMKNADGYLKFHYGLGCEVGGGTIDPKESKDLWMLAKKTQKEGFSDSAQWKEMDLKRYEGHMGEERVKNPVVVLEWFYGVYVQRNAVEISPEAIRDAERGWIDEKMRFVVPGEEGKKLGPYKIVIENGQCGLTHDINQYIKANKALNLKAKMSTYDKKRVLDTLNRAALDMERKIDAMRSIFASTRLYP